MIKFFNPENKAYETIIEDVVLPENLAKFEKGIDENREEVKAAEVVTDVENEPTKKSVRDSSIAWVQHNELTADFYDNVTRVALNVNNQKYNFNLQYLEMLQYGEYSVDGHYDWHADDVLRSDNNDARKLSFSLLISNDDEYEGGDFQICIPNPNQNKIINIKLKQKGTMIFFPSFVWHSIVPVTKGTRYSLVCWSKGNLFK